MIRRAADADTLRSAQAVAVDVGRYLGAGRAGPGAARDPGGRGLSRGVDLLLCALPEGHLRAAAHAATLDLLAGIEQRSLIDFLR